MFKFDRHNPGSNRLKPVDSEYGPGEDSKHHLISLALSKAEQKPELKLELDDLISASGYPKQRSTLLDLHHESITKISQPISFDELNCVFKKYLDYYHEYQHDFKKDKKLREAFKRAVYVLTNHSLSFKLHDEFDQYESAKDFQNQTSQNLLDLSKNLRFLSRKSGQIISHYPMTRSILGHLQEPLPEDYFKEEQIFKQKFGKLTDMLLSTHRHSRIFGNFTNVAGASLIRHAFQHSPAESYCLSEKNLRQTADMYIKMGIDQPEELFEELEKLSLKNLKAKELSVLAKLMRIYARLNSEKHYRFAEKICERALEFADQKETAPLYASIIKSSLCFDQNGKFELSKKLIESFPEDLQKQEHLTIQQALFLLDKITDDQNNFETNNKITRHSQFEKKVARILKRLNVPHQRHQTICGQEADFLINNNIIIECDGPYHFLSSGKASGFDKIRDAVFKKAGYQVIHISLQDLFLADDKVLAVTEKLKGHIEV